MSTHERSGRRVFPLLNDEQMSFIYKVSVVRTNQFVMILLNLFGWF